jgi:hypothetical protein
MIAITDQHWATYSNSSRTIAVFSCFGIFVANLSPTLHHIRRTHPLRFAVFSKGCGPFLEGVAALFGADTISDGEIIALFD